MVGFLSVKESLKYWRSDTPYSTENVVLAPPARNVTFGKCANTIRDLSTFKSIDLEGETPLEVLVSSQAELRHNTRIATRLITQTLPEGSFYEIESGLYVCSPELVFLLAAKMVPLRSLIALGCELCGTYSLFSKSSSAIKHSPITNVSTIREYLGQVPGFHGIKEAKQALGCVTDGSASARETDVYMQYCMRSQYGSFGFSGAELNHTFDLDDYQKVRNFTGMKKITPDLYWPKHRIAIEYESTENHGAYVSNKQLLSINRRKLANDSMRRRTYDAMGIFVLTVTDGEFCSNDDIERIGRLLAKRMNKHDLKQDLESQFRRSQLHDWLKIPIENREDVL